VSDLARLDAELKEYELAYQMTTPDFLLRVADPHDDLSDVEDASFWRATYEIAEKIRAEGDNTVSDLVARLHSLRAQVAGTAHEWLVLDAIARVKYLEAELAEANAKIKLVYDYDSNFIDALGRRALSATPQGSLAGSPIQAKDDQC